MTWVRAPTLSCRERWEENIYIRKHPPKKNQKKSHFFRDQSRLWRPALAFELECNTFLTPASISSGQLPLNEGGHERTRPNVSAPSKVHECSQTLSDADFISIPTTAQ